MNKRDRHREKLRRLSSTEPIRSMPYYAPDLHVRAQTFASDQDRQWFTDHPGATSYERPGFEHEWCWDPVADLRVCEQPGVIGVLQPPTLVTQASEGRRFRKPIRPVIVAWRGEPDSPPAGVTPAGGVDEVIALIELRREAS